MLCGAMLETLLVTLLKQWVRTIKRGGNALDLFITIPDISQEQGSVCVRENARKSLMTVY